MPGWVLVPKIGSLISILWNWEIAPPATNWQPNVAISVKSPSHTLSTPQIWSFCVIVMWLYARTVDISPKDRFVN